MGEWDRRRKIFIGGEGGLSIKKDGKNDFRNDKSYGFVPPFKKNMPDLFGFVSFFFLVCGVWGGWQWHRKSEEFRYGPQLPPTAGSIFHPATHHG